MLAWQFLVCLFLVFGTASYLLRRKLAQAIPAHNRFVNWFFYLWTLYPVGLVVAAIMRPDLRIGWANLALLAVGELMFPLMNVLAYRANEEMDAGLFAIISNLTPVITIATAWLLLREGLTGIQLLGAFVIILAALLANIPRLSRRPVLHARGVAYALASICILGVAITFERFMLTRLAFGAYLVFGWGGQALWMTILAWPERHKMYLIKAAETRKLILAYGLTSSFQGLCFVAALKLSGSASLISIFRSVLSVLVVVTAYIVLRERKGFLYRFSAAAIGALGLVLLVVG